MKKITTYLILAISTSLFCLNSNAVNAAACGCDNFISSMGHRWELSYKRDCRIEQVTNQYGQFRFIYSHNNDNSHNNDGNPQSLQFLPANPNRDEVFVTLDLAEENTSKYSWDNHQIVFDSDPASKTTWLTIDRTTYILFEQPAEPRLLKIMVNNNQLDLSKQERIDVIKRLQWLEPIRTTLSFVRHRNHERIPLHTCCDNQRQNRNVELK